VKSRIALWFAVSQVILWTVLAVPTMLWWRDSLTWVVFMSLYGNWIGGASAVLAVMPNVESQ
jgi:hypothetical protein